MKAVVLVTACLFACVFGRGYMEDDEVMMADDQGTNMILMNFDETCVTVMNDMIHKNIESVFQYIAMAAYFRRHDVDQVGMSLMYSSWSRMKLNLAKMMMMYLIKRGATIEFKDVMKPTETMWTSPEQPLKTTLAMEKEMMTKIKDLNKHAMKHADAHLMAFIEQNLVTQQADYIFEAASYITKVEKGGAKFGVSAMNTQMIKKYKDFRDCESDAEKYKWNY